MTVKTIVRIELPPIGAPLIEVIGSPFGYNIYVGPLVNNTEIEYGALVNLLGVDQSGSIPEQGWRFIDPALPADALRNGLYILWVTHDYSGPFCSGDIQVGFNSALPGHHYANPTHTKDQNLGAATNEWTTLHSNDTLTLLFRMSRKREGD
jgi:hypothetical protein